MVHITLLLYKPFLVIMNIILCGSNALADLLYQAIFSPGLAVVSIKDCKIPTMHFCASY